MSTNLMAKRNIYLSYAITFFIIVLFLLFSQECRHWFIIPVALCGFLVGLDAASWFNGDYKTFDLYGIFGVYGLFFFLLAPLFVVTINYEPRYISNLPRDWRLWIGMMSCLNLVGLLLYYPIRSARDKTPINLKTTWVPSKKNFFLFMPILLVISLALQVLFWMKTGGIGVVGSEEDLSGMGILFMFSESFPYLLLIYFLTWISFTGKRFSKTQIVVMIACFFVMVFIFKGMRGSRSNVVWTIIASLMVFDMMYFNFKKIWILYLAVPFLMFMTAYGLFKNLRGEVFNVQTYGEYVALSEEYGRDWKSMLAGDLGRSDIQALVCYRLMSPNEYRLAYGETYLGAILYFLPGPLRPELRLKSHAGADILYERQYPIAGRHSRKSSRIFGLAGEGMLNFGLIGGPLMFIPYAFGISWARRVQLALRPEDLRCYLFPSLMLIPIYVSMDFGNVLFWTIKNYFFVFIAICLFTIKIKPTCHSD